MKFDPFTDELLRLDSDVNKAVIRFFGNLPHEEILTDLLSDSWVLIDTYEKLSCAIALNSAGEAMTAAIEGRLGDMVKYIGHANKHLGICFERSETRNEFSEKQRNRAKGKRSNPLDDIIKEIQARYPDATWKEGLDFLGGDEYWKVIIEITEDKIKYCRDNKTVELEIASFPSKWSRLKEK